MFIPPPNLDMARNMHVLPLRGIGVVFWVLPSLLPCRIGVLAQESSKHRDISSGVWGGENWSSIMWTFLSITNPSPNILLGKLIFFSQPRNSTPFMEHEDILPCSQHPATGLYPAPDKSSPFFKIFLYDKLHYILTFTYTVIPRLTSDHANEFLG